MHPLYLKPSTTTVDLTTLWPSNRSSAGHHNSYTPSSHELHLSGILYLRVWSPRLLSLLLNILYMLLSNCFLGLHALLLADWLFMYIPCMQVYTEIIIEITH